MANMSGSKVVGFARSLVGANTDAIVHRVYRMPQDLGLTTADLDSAAGTAKDAAEGTHFTHVTNDGYWLKGHIVSVMICSNVDVDQTVSVKSQRYIPGGIEDFFLEKDVPMSLAPNNVIELSCIYLENDLSIKVSCTEGVDVFVNGLIDIGVA